MCFGLELENLDSDLRRLFISLFSFVLEGEDEEEEKQKEEVAFDPVCLDRSCVSGSIWYGALM